MIKRLQNKIVIAMFCQTSHVRCEPDVEGVLEAIFRLDFSSYGLQDSLEEQAILIPDNPFLCFKSNGKQVLEEEPMRKLRIASGSASFAPPKIFYGRFWRSLARRALYHYSKNCNTTQQDESFYH